MTIPIDIQYSELSVPSGPGDQSYIPIRHTETHEEVGHILLTGAHFGNCYIAWYMDEEWQGKGLMRASLKQLLPLLMQHIHRLVAVIKTTNGRSQNLARAAGFRYEGTAVQGLRDGNGYYDAEFWALLVDDLPTSP